MAEAFRERLLTVLGTLQPKQSLPSQPQFLAQQQQLTPLIQAPAPAPVPLYVSGPPPVPLSQNVMMPFSTFIPSSIPRASKIPWNFLCIALLLSGLGLGIAITLLVLDMREQKQEKRLHTVQ